MTKKPARSTFWRTQLRVPSLTTTSANSNGVATLGLSVSDPPTQSEVQQLADKVDELILALRQA